MKRREFALAGAGATVASLAGCSLFDDSSGSNEYTGWTTFRGDPARTGVRDADAGPGESLSISWEATWHDILAEENGYPGDEDSPVAGRVTWPVLSEENVIWTSTHRPLDKEEKSEPREQLVAVDQATGAIQWVQDLSAQSILWWYPPTMHDGELYLPEFHAREFGISVFDPETGDRKRELELGASVRNTTIPLISDGRVYLTTTEGDSTLHAFDSKTGEELWSVPIEWFIGSRVFGAVADETLVHFEHLDDEFVGRDVTDGSEHWRESIDLPDSLQSNSSTYLSPPVVDTGTAYAAGHRQGLDRYFQGIIADRAPLVSINTDDGNERFQYQPPKIDGESNPQHILDRDTSIEDTAQLSPYSSLFGLPVVIEDLVIATGYGSHNGTDGIHCFAVTKNGELDWAVESGLSYAPVASGEVVYLVSNEGVQAISTDGERLDTVDLVAKSDAFEALQIEDKPKASPALGDGRLYVPTRSGIVALE